LALTRGPQDVVRPERAHPDRVRELRAARWCWPATTAIARSSSTP